MRKKNGFVFMETIVVISILSITLLILFSSYAYILRKSRERNTFNTTETIYKTYYVKQIIDSMKPSVYSGSGIQYYIENHSTICKKMDSYNSYVCDLSSEAYNGDLVQIKRAFEVEKFYLVNPYEVKHAANKNDWLNQFDATTIDYINDIGDGTNTKLLIVKYKKLYGKTDGSYEVFHSSIEVG